MAATVCHADGFSASGACLAAGEFQGTPVSIVSTMMGQPNMDFVVRECRQAWLELAHFTCSSCCAVHLICSTLLCKGYPRVPSQALCFQAFGCGRLTCCELAYSCLCGHMAPADHPCERPAPQLMLPQLPPPQGSGGWADGPHSTGHLWGPAAAGRVGQLCGGH